MSAEIRLRFGGLDALFVRTRVPKRTRLEESFYPRSNVVPPQEKSVTTDEKKKKVKETGLPKQRYTIYEELLTEGLIDG